MTTLEDLERRVLRLEARNAIGELASAYAVACDEHDIDRIASLFTEDAVFDAPSGFMDAHGRQAIVEMFDRVLAMRGPGYHWTHDHFIRFDQGSEDQASGLLLSHAETTPGGVMSLAAMKYDDVYRVEDGIWRFAKRTISFLYYVPVSEYGDVLNQTNRLKAGNERLPADYPESLATWQAFDARHRQA
ncbi:MAG: nuclear transport factor 2 family protein [Burkholderiaceae bacterium]